MGAGNRTMKRPLDKSEARAYQERWRHVRAHEIAELRSMTLQTRWEQFQTLLVWARQFDWSEALEEGVAEVRERWARIRKAQGAQKTEI